MGTGPLRGALARIIRAYLPHKCEAVHINKKNWKGIATRRLKRLLSIALPTYSRRRLSHLIAIGAGSARSRVMRCDDDGSIHRCWPQLTPAGNYFRHRGILMCVPGT